MRAAIAGLKTPPRQLEYPIWLWDLGDERHFPSDIEVCPWRLGIGCMHPTKLAAIAAHRSQLGLVVDDDPQGFVLPSELLERFTQPWELFLEIPTDTSPMVLPYK